MHSAPSPKISRSKFVALWIGFGLWMGIGTGCARHGQTSISWMWKSTPSSFGATVSDWLPLDRLMSLDRNSDAAENLNAKVTANSAEVSLSGNDAEQPTAEGGIGIASVKESRSSNWLSWNLGMNQHVSAAAPSSDPFLKADFNTAADHESSTAKRSEPSPYERDPHFQTDPARLVVETLPPPEEDAAHDIDSLIGSIEEGTRDADSIDNPDETNAEDSAMVRLRDLLAEEETADGLEPASNAGSPSRVNVFAEDRHPSQLDRETKLIGQRVESLLESANERLLLGNLNDAHRLCLQAQMLARSSAIPLNYRISPTKLLREIENRKTDAAIQLVETSKKLDVDRRASLDHLHDGSIEGVATLTSSAPSADRHTLMTERTAEASTPSIEQDVPRKYSRRAVAPTSNSAEQWDVEAADQTLVTAQDSRTSPDRASSAGTLSSARLIANGSARVIDTRVSPTSLSVPFDEPQRAETPPAPSFLPPEWSRWESDDELSDGHEIERSARHGREPAGTESLDDQFATAATPANATRLNDISWDDEESEKGHAAAEDETQSKLMLGLICLLVGLSAATLLRHSRRRVPVAMPVDLSIPAAAPPASQG
ncbi:MAG: hypothetical protein WEB58_04495 [Planctomycetaceae bacterium]